jgi:anti-sigma-K factor RskA
MNSNDHVIELLPAYAIGCLDKEETDLVDAHLSSCLVCQAELQVYQAISEQLPLAAPMAEPAVSVKQQLFERVESKSRQPTRGPQAVNWLERLKSLGRQIMPLWGLASLVLVLALVTSNLLLWREVNQLHSQAQVADMRVVSLSGTGAAPGATGLMVISVDGSHGTLVVDRLPVLDESRQYQLWLIKDNQRTSGGVFSVSRSGYASLWVHAPEPLADYPSYGITVEPEGGSPGPTGEKVLGGNL